MGDVVKAVALIEINTSYSDVAKIKIYDIS